MSKETEVLNQDVLVEFIEWAKKKYAYDTKMVTAKLLNVMRRKIIRVASGKLDDKCEYNELMKEFLRDKGPEVTNFIPPPSSIICDVTDEWIELYESEKKKLNGKVPASIFWRIGVTHLPEGVNPEDERVIAIQKEIGEVLKAAETRSAELCGNE